ncbi:hypothetical protein PIB30_052190 [Stylosanthes scabra]|uniref:Fungal lipase-type domain-containing protein n=1 Tax=Stylosanthes scabra TaxID=79078 RepID=A0ABU6VG80_9FABA|nr:hypothetical protein [Stylosanthes scabra]
MASKCNKSFAKSYLLLKPEEATLLDLVRILFSPNIGHRKCLESHSPETTVERSFNRRFLIVFSIAVQKFLMAISKPLAFIGSCIEMFINILCLNGGLFTTLIRALTGKLVIPDRKSSMFLSFIGNLDYRTRLGAIKRQDCRYYVYLAMMASKVSYENQAFLQDHVTNNWEMEYVGFYDCWNDYQEKSTTQVLIFLEKHEDGDTYVVSFRGTEPFDADAWSTDVDLSWYEIPGVGKMHAGFMKALGLQKNLGWPKEEESDDDHHPPFAYYVVRDILRKALSENEKTKFIVTGHSLGGALAILFPTIMFMHDERLLIERLQGIYTFGQPRVGDEAYAEFMRAKFKENSVSYCRFVYCNDIVPRLPWDDHNFMFFKHFGVCLFFNRRYQLQILEEEPNKNYFSVWYVIPMMFNAILEIIRSFRIAHIHGPGFREGWLCFIFRLIGILIPGVPAHCPQDYVNSTLLGSIEKHFKAD